MLWKLGAVRTASVYCMAYGLLGLLITSLGPALLELARRTDVRVVASSDGSSQSLLMQTSIETMTFVFTSRSGGYLGGSIVGGMLFDRFDGHKLLVLALSICTLGTVGIALASSIGVCG